ncbi:MAG: PAS domain S-box protein [Nitrospinae bacterium]|nr:PAS domain S-box protein [Nitrospinota bacterium]
MPVILLITVTSLLAWYAIYTIKERIKTEKAHILQSVLETTHASLKLWVDDRIHDMMVQTSKKAVAKHTKILLEAHKRGEKLLNHPSLLKLRNIMEPEIKAQEDLGFFLIAPDFISIASMRDKNMGAKNLLAGTGYLNKIFDGKPQLILPMKSDVPVPRKDGTLSVDEPTMFIGVPFYDNGKVIAAFTFRLNPSRDFSRIMTLGSIGSSGSTYGFNGKGLLITESRFDNQLRDSGFLKQNERAILKIAIRDPGRDIRKGTKPITTKGESPFTLMAQSALEGNDGGNYDGYHDYRGVPVIGIWKWDKDLNMGFASEMNIEEAYDVYYTTRTLTIAVIGITVTIALFFGLRLRKTIKLSERLRNEAMENEERLKTIFHGVLNGIVTINGMGIIESVNQSVEKIFGYKPEELIGKNVKILMPEPYFSEHDGYLSNYRNTGTEKIIGKGREVLAKKKNGEVFPIHLSVNRMLIGDTTMFAGVITDISERVRNEEELKNKSEEIESSNQFMQAILDGTSHSLISTELDGTITLFNKGAEKLLNYSEEEMVHKTTPAIFHDGSEVVERAKVLTEELGREIKPGFEAFVAKVNDGSIDTNIWTYIAKDGVRIPVELTVTALTNLQGEITGYLGIATNIAERIKSEEELKKAKEHAEISAQRLNELLITSEELRMQAQESKENAERFAEEAKKASMAKSDFLATMSHEIRTPMNGIIGMATLLKDTDLDVEQADCIETILSSGQSLLTIINDILDFSKIEAGKLEFEIGDLDIELAVDGVIQLFVHKAREKNIALKTSYPKDIPLLRGDTGRLRQVLMNLVGNAIKFTEQGEVAVEVSITNSNNNKATVLIKVRDTGIGLSDEEREKLFKPFVQADSSTSRRYGGTGLGLTISRRLVELMDGSICVESEKGKGSTFYIEIKLPFSETVREKVLRKKERKTEKKKIQLNREVKILLAEDNQVNQKVASMQLLKLGYVADIASNGGEVLLRLKSNRYDLVLMDCQMPEIDGFEATRRIRKMEKETGERLPIIAMTANAMKGDRERCLEAGMDDYMSKPVDIDVLEDMILKYVGEKSPIIKPSKQDAESVESSGPDSINHATIDKLKALGADDTGFFKELVSVFLESAEKHVDDLMKCLPEKNAGHIHQISHPMKSSCANMGAMKLAHLFTMIDDKAKIQDVSDFESLAKQVEEEFMYVKNEFQKMLEDL